MKIVTVIPLERGIFKTDLTYFTSKDINAGDIVSVPVRNKTILGLVVSYSEVRDAKSDVKDMSFNLKKISEVKKRSIFRKEFIDSGMLLSEYFASNKNGGLVALIPSIFRERYDEIEKFSPTQEASEIQEENSKKIKVEKLLFQARFEERISYYKTLIRGQFALKKSVFIVLPTEYDIEIFYQSLSKGIENFTFSLHGGVKQKKIIESYEQIVNSSHGVLIIGTAQFLSIPRNDIGTIILEHESSTAFKMIPKPHFDVRIFAEIFAAKINAKFILADTLLRYETIARKEIDGLSEVYPMSFRTNFDGIMIDIINTKKDPYDASPSESFKIFSEKNIEEIRNTLKKNRNVFIFSLRKGLATYTVCKDCNETVNCDKCLAPVVLYLTRDGKKRMFTCNKCKTEKDPEIRCSYCGSWNLMPLGIGTDTVYEEITTNFPKNNVFKLDKESANTETKAEKIINEFEKHPGSILIGTEMAFFYLKEKVDLSVVASFDSLWSIPNYKISEKIIQLLLSILSKTNEKLIIQTKNKNDSALLSVKSENLISYVREELNDRKNLNYPPYSRFIKVTYQGDKQSSIEAKTALEKIFHDYQPDIFGGYVAKNKNQFAVNALIKIDLKKWSLPEISSGAITDKNLFKVLTSLPPEFEISVDPEDLM